VTFFVGGVDRVFQIAIDFQAVFVGHGLFRGEFCNFGSGEQLSEDAVLELFWNVMQAFEVFKHVKPFVETTFELFESLFELRHFKVNGPVKIEYRAAVGF